MTEESPAVSRIDFPSASAYATINAPETAKVVSGCAAIKYMKSRPYGFRWIVASSSNPLWSISGKVSKRVVGTVNGVRGPLRQEG
jgi:hypothetical protein